MDTDTALDIRPDLAAELVLLPDITLYFPLPIIFYVSPQQPQLAQRLEAGLNRARQDGSFERLFTSHFAQELHMIREGGGRRISLTNPFVPKELASEKALDATGPRGR
jgi:hypothetical protein